MGEISHRAIIFFLCILWLLVIFVCVINMYYFAKVYNDGGSENVSDSQAYTYSLISGMILILSILCFIGVFYIYYEENKRVEHHDELEVGLIISGSEISAINKTYQETSNKLSRDIQDQMDYQVRGTARVLSSKNKELNDKDNVIYDKDQKIYDMSNRQDMLENEIDKLSSELDNSRSELERLKREKIDENNNNSREYNKMEPQKNQQKMKKQNIDLQDEDIDEDSSSKKNLPVKKQEIKRKSLLEDL